MIWNINDTSNSWGWATKLRNFSINGITFDVYKKSNHGGTSGESAKQWTYIAFVSRTNILQATWNIDEFINYLIDKDIISTNNYISSVELGNEIFTGSGIVKITDYSVIVK